MTNRISFEEFTYLSADGRTNVHAYCWAPALEKPLAIIQLSHGMCEYVERYDAWARRFAERGIVFCGNDHLGHGHTAPDAEELGFTAEKHSEDYLVEDLHTMTQQMKARYGQDIPLILYGHSMGSFVARLYLTRYGNELSGAILSGTAGPEQPTGLALRLTNLLSKVKNEHHRSRFLTALAFGAYNKKFKGENDSLSWLTSDGEVRAAYAADPLCDFVFTLSGYRTLFSLLHAVSGKKWAENVPKHLPLFLFAGDMDPVGNNGKGVTRIYERLQKAGANVTLKLYKGGRHEMHHEKEKDTVFADILEFIAKIPVPCEAENKKETL